ncbi:MAG: DUF2255 family protein [Myxococcota bacterium]|nr:DUF2255 family protein [Myxococcota bacterium]
MAEPVPASARRRRGRASAAGLAALLLLAAVPAPGADDVAWSRHADEETVTVVTTTEEGEPRETTVWLVVVDGRGFLRTGGTRWGGDVERDPDVALRVGGETLPLTVAFVEDEALRERVTRAFRAKYGWTDAVIGLFRWGRPKILELRPRDAQGAP